MVATLTLADLGGRLGPDADGTLREAIDRAADQLAEAAVSTELGRRSAGVAKSVD